MLIFFAVSKTRVYSDRPALENTIRFNVVQFNLKQLIQLSSIMFIEGYYMISMC